MSWHGSPRYGHVTWSADTLFWQLSIDHNMDVYYQVKHRLQAPKLARKFDISHWFPCGVDGRAYGHIITKISQMSRWPNFLKYKASHAWSSAVNVRKQITVC